MQDWPSFEKKPTPHNVTTPFSTLATEKKMVDFYSSHLLLADEVDLAESGSLPIPPAVILQLELHIYIPFLRI